MYHLIHPSMKTPQDAIGELSFILEAVAELFVRAPELSETAASGAYLIANAVANGMRDAEADMRKALADPARERMERAENEYRRGYGEGYAKGRKDHFLAIVKADAAAEPSALDPEIQEVLATMKRRTSAPSEAMSDTAPGVPETEQRAGAGAGAGPVPLLTEGEPPLSGDGSGIAPSRPLRTAG